MSDSIANGYGCRPCKQVQLNVTDAIIHFIGDGSALSHLNASNVDFGTLSTTVFPASGVTVGTYGSSANVAQVTIDTYGRVTSATNVAITSSQWTGTPGSPIYYIPGVGVGSSTPATANLQVTGNVYVSNAVTTTNVYAATEILTGTTDQTTLNVTGNVYVSNAVTTMNVFANTYYGDGGLLSNVGSQWTGNKGSPIYYIPGVGVGSSTPATANLQVTGNVYVSNAVTTTNVNITDTLDVLGSLTANAANATFFFDTFTIPYINTQELNVASNIVLTGNLSAPLANITTLNVNYLTVNSAVVYGTSTLNVYGVSNLSTATMVGLTGETTLNVTGNIYASNALTTTDVFATTANIATTNTQTLTVTSNMTFTGPLATLSNLTVPGNANIEYLSVSNLSVTGNLYVTATNVQTTNALTINNSGTMTALKVTQNETSIHTHNVAEFWDATTLAMVIDPEGNVAIHTVSSPGYALTVTDPANFETLYIRGKPDVTSLDVTGNVYVSNALVTTNVLAATELLTGASGQTTLNVTGNIYASNSLTTTNLFTVGIRSNVTSTTFNYDTLTIPFITCSTLNVESTSNLDVVTITGEPGLTSLNVTGNIYASNALVTTNIFANREVLAGTVGQTTLNVTGNIYASNAVTTTNVFATTLSTTNPIPFRNRIFNGGMSVWQRNTAAISTTSCVYTTADRWCGALGTSGLILSQWPGPTEAPQFPYSLQVTTSTTTSGVPLVEQRIENLNIPDFLNGTPVTVSFYAGQPYGTLMPLTVGLYYATAVNNFGTQTLAVAATKNTPTLTTSNVYYTLNFTLTTSLGATNGLSLRFTTGAASAIGSTVLLTGVQVEKGLLATPFEVRPYVTELALCQRYYYQLTSPTAAVQGSAQVYAIFGTATGITTTAFWLPIQFPGPMRTPNYLLSNSAVSNFQLLPTGTTTITSVGLQTDSYTPVSATLNFVGTNIVAGSSYIFRTNGLTGSTTAFFGFSCEL